MKTLTLLRHAKSGWDDPVARDFDRALNARGMRGAQTVGRHMAALGLVFDHVVSSPAVRCIDTLDGVWEGYGTTLHPHWERRIYLASGVTLLDVVHDQSDAHDRVLMCGHNPGLEDLVLMLVPDREDDLLRDGIEDANRNGQRDALALRSSARSRRQPRARGRLINRQAPLRAFRGRDPARCAGRFAALAVPSTVAARL